MRRFWQVFLIFTICITGALAEKLESGKAYIVSSINVNSTGNIEAGKSYSLVPQVVIATGSEDYAGSVTLFTGCYDGKRYEKGIYQASCLTSVINNLSSTNTTDALSAAQGKILNDKFSNVYTKEEIDNKISNAGVSASDLLTMIYPVGSIYMSTSNVSPESFLGGKWRALDEGRVLIGANNTYTAGSKGGEASHTLTTSEMPSHTHIGPSHSHSIPALSGSTSSNGGHTPSGSIASNGAHTHTRGTMNITGEQNIAWGDASAAGAIINYNTVKSGSALYAKKNNSYSGWTGATETDWGNNRHYDTIVFDASRNWTGSTSSNGSHSHTLTMNAVSNHTHTVTTNASSTGSSGDGNTGSAGNSNAHNNMQPYLAVYMWERYE